MGTTRWPPLSTAYPKAHTSRDSTSRSAWGDRLADRRALQDMLTDMVEQLALLREHVAQLGLDRGGTMPSEPERNATVRTRLLSEIDAVEVLAWGARARVGAGPMADR